MFRSRIAGIGMYVPDQVISNDDLTKVMNTSDEWIQERTGVKERRYAKRFEETTTTMGVEAAKIAIGRAGLTPTDIDFIIFATLSPDYYFPGCGVLVQRTLQMREVGALDIRNQCSGFIYGLSVADQFIKTGMYKNHPAHWVRSAFIRARFLNPGPQRERHLWRWSGGSCVAANYRRQQGYAEHPPAQRWK
jgi:3-oxoacyl-[acyl-carrier-protein] synthase III